MGFNSFPPQAYTREVLAEAYEWLSGQPPSIKEIANDANTLVALFLQSKRRPLNDQKDMGFKTDPVSSKSFKNDLKDLARGFQEFDDPQEHSATTEAVKQMFASQPERIPSPQPPMGSQGFSGPQIQQNFLVTPHGSTNESAPSAGNYNLDRRSLDAVRAVQQKLNLSSEAEALRALVALGYEIFKNKLL